MSRNGNAENTAAIATLIRMLQYNGLWHWPYDGKGNLLYRLLRRWHRYLLHVPITFVFILLMSVELSITRNLEKAAHLIPMTLTEWALLFKFQFFWRRRSQTYEFIKELNENAIFRLRQHERKFWQENQQKFERMAKLYMSVATTICFIIVCDVLSPYKYEMPFPYYVPYDWRNPRTCWFAYIYGDLGLLLTCFSSITIDLLVCYLMFHFTLLYKLIGRRMVALQHLTKEAAVVEELRSIIKLHQHVWNMTKTVESIISLPVLTQIVLNAFVLCFTIYYLQNLSFKGNASYYFIMGLFINVISLEIFLSCYYAELLTEATENLQNCLYDCHWEKYSVSTRKLIYLYMEFLKIPATFKAGNFFIIGLPIFSKTMNNAYSLCCVLLNMND